MEGDIRKIDLKLSDIRDDWGSNGTLDGLPPKVSPMDVDAFEEINGWMQMIERDRFGKIKSGQLRALIEFSKKQNCESVIVRGEKNTFPHVRIYSGGTIDRQYDWSAEPVEVQRENFTRYVFVPFTIRAGRQPRARRFQTTSHGGRRTP